MTASVAVCGQEAKAQQQQSLVLTASITGQQYCANNGAMATLQLRLRLRYTNVGGQKLILYRGEDLFYQAKIRRVVVETGAKPYEIAVLNAMYLEQENEPVEQPAPNKLFVILPSGASYETETVVGVGVVGQGVARDRHAIVEGEHTLQLVVSTWYRSRNLALKLREQWRRKGVLWFDPVISNAITFNAARPQQLSPCR